MDTLEKSHTPQDGPVTPEIALAAAGKTGEGGRELSDAERQAYADRIEEAARAHAAWRDSRLAAGITVGEAVGVLTGPVIFVPEADDPSDYPTAKVTDKDGRVVTGWNHKRDSARDDDDGRDREG